MAKCGTHNGMKSVVQNLNTENFPRIRIGIGAPENKELLINYVIGKISKEEQNVLNEGVEKAVKALEELIKNVVLFDNVQVPHYNYVGDSVLGYKSHMGAGSITSNVKSDKTLVVVKNGDEHIETGLKKFGAMLGDNVEVGCNSVLNPGTVIGTNSNIYPVSCVRGVVPANSIYKSQDNIVEKE